MNEAKPDPGTLHPDARLVLFGHDPTPATVALLRRSRRWRLFRALRIVAVVLVLAPVSALVPPHAPWVLGVLVGGGLLAWRRWQERYTLVSLRARCPRCDAEITTSRRSRLRHPHPVSCEACHHDAALEVAGGAPPP